MVLRWASRSHPGCLRQNNEDTIACHGDQGLWLLADGMGGHQAGEVASQLACEIVAAALKQGHKPQSAYELAHQQILAQSEGQQSGMGTTLVSLQQHSKDQYCLSWVGDSRAYLWRKGELQQLSHDHSYVQSLIDSGQINPEQARQHPEKNIITQCMGAIEYGDMAPETISGHWSCGDMILLCSDGLNDELNDEEIRAILASDNDIEQQLLSLETAALEAGGSDNVSLLAIAFDAKAPYNGEANTIDCTQFQQPSPVEADAADLIDEDSEVTKPQNTARATGRVENTDADKRLYFFAAMAVLALTLYMITKGQ